MLFSLVIQDSSAGIETRHRMINSQQRLDVFHFSIASRLAVGATVPLIQWITRPVSMGIKQQEHKADQSLLPIAEVKTGGATYALSHPPYVLMAKSIIN
jgi:hypothetical protein